MTRFPYNGLSLTIKPDGNVYFYGIETKAHGNIFKNKLSIEYYCRLARASPFINRLYSTSFSDFISSLQEKSIKD